MQNLVRLFGASYLFLVLSFFTKILSANSWLIFKKSRCGLAIISIIFFSLVYIKARYMNSVDVASWERGPIERVGCIGLKKNGVPYVNEYSQSKDKANEILHAGLQ